MMIFREIGALEVTEQRLADQTKVIRTNGWLSEVELQSCAKNMRKIG